MTKRASEFSGFFEHVRNGQLCFPFCSACQRFHWYPMPRCPRCRNANWHWKQVSGAGEIYSFTEVCHPFDPERRDTLPYIVALVVFADAPDVRLIANVVGTDAASLRIGQRVEAVFPAQDEGQPYIIFQLSANMGEA